MSDETQNNMNMDELNEKLAAAEKERDEYRAGWQRAKADFINYKQEEAKHLQDTVQYGNVDIIKDMISVLDNFDLGLRALEKSGPVEKGVYLIRSQIEDILRKKGLVRIEIKAGDSFDPSIAEALTEIPSDHPPGSVVEQIEPGYKLHDKVIRAARVIVSKG